MEVFISWSGERSRAVATALREWIPLVCDRVEPWLSASDIRKGSRWSGEIAKKLETCSAGIVCVTRESINAPWLLFEAGALSKQVGMTLVCTYLIDVTYSDIAEPLQQFQATDATEKDTKALISTLNGALGQDSVSEARLCKRFDLLWPLLETQVITIKQAPDRSIDLSNPFLEKVRELRSRQANELSDSALAEMIANASPVAEVSRQEYLAHALMLAMRGHIPDNDIVVIDFRPLLGPAGKTVPLRTTDYETVTELLDQLWCIMEGFAPGTIPAFTYGKSWILRDADGHLLTDIGPLYAEALSERRDSRPLDYVGIHTGDRFDVVRYKPEPNAEYS